ncbi:rod shape-determining protein [Ornithinimicrobium cryptoxanthini]|uniref:Cell shape-determining protein MreB n=1 Tax=Ornithinimicrobium cryptoxanthini TaxID=2934161 RepID=A0ABY4YGF0_9MICO|nr:rod shape-determining protein [Ornithinimicrobium cryptoxanthini]USQ75423.1 rod shape-determining protein [Ornithinimicrobium cryptoxanthini]
MSNGWGLSLLGRDLALDLGSSNTLIHQQDRGVVLDEPTLVAVDSTSGQLVAAGQDAVEMLGRTPASVVTVHPLVDGVVTDADLTESMLSHFIQQLRISRLVRPRMVVCVPSSVTPVERRALEDTAMHSGARRVFVLEEAMAAAIGAGLPVHDATASLVVDIGGGTTEVAVISLGGIVNARSLRVGGDEVDEAIVAGVRATHDLLLGERSAQDIKVTIGSAYPLTEELDMRVRGRVLGTGLPRTVTLTSTEVRRMIEPPVLQVVDVVKAVLDICPPELSGDVLDNGIVLTGGGALLRGLDERLRRELGVPVRVADDPTRAVIRGAGACVDDFAALERVLVGPRRR